MDKVCHPYRMTIDEVQTLLRILPRAKVFIDIFGGSGIVSELAMKSGKYSEVIYCDRRKFVQRIDGVEIFHCDYTEVLPFADKSAIVFADPPFFAMSNFDRLENKDCLKIVEKLAEVDAKVYMLNSKELYRFAKDKLQKIMPWKFRQDDPELRGRVYLYKVRV